MIKSDKEFFAGIIFINKKSLATSKLL